MMALLKYFQRSNPFPSPEGPLSMKAVSFSIQAANNKVEEVLSQATKNVVRTRINSHREI